MTNVGHQLLQEINKQKSAISIAKQRFTNYWERAQPKTNKVRPTDAKNARRTTLNKRIHSISLFFFEIHLP